jgi:predicted DNA-binding protein YlxM (UPF0122 family)
MTRREYVLNKLQSLSNDEISEAIKQLTHHVKARLRFRSLIDRTKTGAHGEKNLGMHAIDYYVGECITRLYSPDGWDWKYEKFTLAEQLMRIANKLLSDKVQEYIKKKPEMPVFDDRDAGDIYDLDKIATENIENEMEVFSKLVQLAHEQSKGDDNLEYFTLRYFEKASFETIANEMNISNEQVYVLRKKLVRRLTNLRKELTA